MANKTPMPAEKERKSISDESPKIKRNPSNESIRVRVSFENDDVPNYLKRLDEFDKKSKWNNWIVK